MNEWIVKFAHVLLWTYRMGTLVDLWIPAYCSPWSSRRVAGSWDRCCWILRARALLSSVWSPSASYRCRSDSSCRRSVHLSCTLHPNSNVVDGDPHEEKCQTVVRCWYMIHLRASLLRSPHPIISSRSMLARVRSLFGKSWIRLCSQSRAPVTIYYRGGKIWSMYDVSEN